MKRILVLALTIIFVLSISSFAFASDTETSPVIFYGTIAVAAANVIKVPTAKFGPLPALQLTIVGILAKNWDKIMHMQPPVE